MEPVGTVVPTNTFPGAQGSVFRKWVGLLPSRPSDWPLDVQIKIMLFVQQLPCHYSVTNMYLTPLSQGIFLKKLLIVPCSCGVVLPSAAATWLAASAVVAIFWLILPPAASIL